MADRTANFANNWSSTLTAEMGPTDLAAVVADTSDAPASPCYLVIDLDDDAKREYIWFNDTFTATNFVTTSTGNRYLEGSAAASGITHSVGASVMAITPAQALRDLHDRITAVAAAAVGDHNHDADYAELGHTHAGAATVLDLVAYHPASLQTPNATTSAVALDGTNLKTTFTATTTSVLVELSALANGSVDSSSELLWSLYDAASGGSIVGVAQAVWSNISGDLGGTFVWVSGHVRLVVTGLTVDTEYTWYWRHQRSVSGSSSPGTRYGGKAGAAVMKVTEL